MNKKKFIIIAGAVVFVYLVALVLIWGSKNKSTETSPDNFVSHPESYDNAPQAIKEVVDQSYYVQLFSETLPYRGKHLFVKYDFEGDIFTAYIPNEFKTDGEKELDNLLQKNNIESRTWIKNLNVVYE